MIPVLWGRASSVNVQKVMWALAECDVSYERIDAGGKYGRTNTDEFAQMAPLRRVPVWQEEGLNLWESHAILRHLGRGPAAKFWPEGPRALADQWMEFTTSTLQPPLIRVFFQKVRFTEAERSEAELAKGLKALEAALDIVEDRLTKTKWIAGDQMTLGDFTIGALLYRYFDMDIPRPDRPALSAFYDKLGERQAYRDTVMTSYDELRPS